MTPERPPLAPRAPVLGPHRVGATPLPADRTSGEPLADLTVRLRPEGVLGPSHVVDRAAQVRLDEAPTGEAALG